MSLFTRLIAVLLLSATLAACAACAAAPAATPTTAPKAASPITASISSSTATTSSAQTATPASGAAASPAAATPAASPNALPALATGQIRFTLVPADSEARFRVKEQLANASLPNDAVGTTKDVSGQIVVDASGQVVKGSSKITVNITNLTSDRGQRDNFIRQNTLETARFLEVVFVPTEVRGLASPLPTSGNVTFELVGDLTIKGVTKSTTWQVTGRVQGNDLRGTASTAVTFGDFGMAAPRVAVVLSVEDNIRLEIDFHLTRSSS